MKIHPRYTKPNSKVPIINGVYLYKKRGTKKYTQIQMICIIQGCKGWRIYNMYRFVKFTNSTIFEIHEKTFKTAIREDRVKLLS